MNEISQYYNVESNATRAAWLVGRCTGSKWTLHSIVPEGFASYVRILHPAWSAKSLDPNDEKAWRQLRSGWREAEDLKPIRWDETAAKNNHVTHRAMQWFDICSRTVREPGMAGVDPPLEGTITPKMVEGLFEILIGHSGESQEILCGFWEGCTQDFSSQTKAQFRRNVGITYNLFNTTLAGARDSWLAANEYSSKNHGIGTNGLIPNIIWPTTQDWHLTVDFNLFSTNIGGSTYLIDSIRDADDLETYEALAGDNIF